MSKDSHFTGQQYFEIFEKNSGVFKWGIFQTLDDTFRHIGRNQQTMKVRLAN